MKEVGTLRELDVKPGDVVECVSGPTFGGEWTVGKRYTMTDKGLPCDRNGPQSSSVSTFCIISRATTAPKLWRDMTPEEKGALLLAAHEGRVIEWLCGTVWFAMNPGWKDNVAYRIKQEPKVEEIQQGYKTNASGKFVTTSSLDHATHKVTIDLIDGVPDCDSVNMVAIA